MSLRIFQCCIIFLTIAWISSDTDSDSVCPDNLSTVEVKIKTGDVLFAGTNSWVSLVLRSNHGIICQDYDLNNIGNDRERNSIDKYKLCCPIEFVADENELSMVAFAHIARTGKKIPFFSDDWFIEHMEVRANENILFNYRFHCWSSTFRKLVFGVSKVNNTDYVHF